MCDGDGPFKHPLTVFVVARMGGIFQKLLASVLADFPLRRKLASVLQVQEKTDVCGFLLILHWLFLFQNKFGSAALHSPGRYPAPVVFLC